MNINEIERVLAAEPRNVRALILKADHLANAGDARSASSYYLAALKAAGPPQQAPAAICCPSCSGRARCTSAM